MRSSLRKILLIDIELVEHIENGIPPLVGNQVKVEHLDDIVNIALTR